MNENCLNIFKTEPPKLDNETVNDLLDIRTEGRARMESYIHTTFISVSSKNKSTKRNRKMKTFSRKRATSRTQKSKLGIVTLLLKRAYMQIQKSGKYLARTLEYPLALCNEFGDMRDRHKSKFRGVIESDANFENMFKTELSFSININQQK